MDGIDERIDGVFDTIDINKAFILEEFDKLKVV